MRRGVSGQEAHPDETLLYLLGTLTHCFRIVKVADCLGSIFVFYRWHFLAARSFNLPYLEGSTNFIFLFSHRIFNVFYPTFELSQTGELSFVYLFSDPSCTHRPPPPPQRSTTKVWLLFKKTKTSKKGREK